MEVADPWASMLPDDLLLDILRRLGGAAVMRCAGVCKPWRRAITGGASTLRPRRPDVFVPGLLLGFVPNFITGSNSLTSLHPAPPAPPSQPGVLPEPNNGRGDDCSTIGRVLSSRDGFVLIYGIVGDLCLRNLVTGACWFLPSARLGGYKACSYALITSYDDQETTASSSTSSQQLEVRILAVKVVVNGGSGHRNSFHYQIFTATSSGTHDGGAWGPVQWSQDFDGAIVPSMGEKESNEVICRGGVVHWLAGNGTCAVALDVRTGRTWTTLLPQSGRATSDDDRVVLATSGDGERLSVIRWLKEQQEILVWELTNGGGGGGGDQWIQRRAIDVRKLLVPGAGDNVWVVMDAFCPRSGCLSIYLNAQMLLLDLDRGSTTYIHDSCLGCRPYHVDWSSYWSMCVSKMKYF